MTAFASRWAMFFAQLVSIKGFVGDRRRYFDYSM